MRMSQILTFASLSPIPSFTVNLRCYIFLFKYSRTTHPKVDLTGLQTHDFQIMDGTFHVPETLVL